MDVRQGAQRRICGVFLFAGLCECMGWCWWVVSEDEGGGLVFEVDLG